MVVGRADRLMRALALLWLVIYSAHVCAKKLKTPPSLDLLEYLGQMLEAEDELIGPEDLQAPTTKTDSSESKAGKDAKSEEKRELETRS